VGAFLATHNALHLWLRVWGMDVGLREGLGVARALRDAPLQLLGERAASVGALLAGFAAVRMVASAGHGPLELGAGAVAVVAGALLGGRTRPVVSAGLAAAFLAALALARTP
jgi:mannose PTS system EIID component